MCPTCAMVAFNPLFSRSSNFSNKKQCRCCSLCQYFDYFKFERPIFFLLFTDPGRALVLHEKIWNSGKVCATSIGYV